MDRRRLAALVHAHHAAVFQSAWRITRNVADAEDVVQQLFLGELQRPAGPRPAAATVGDAAAVERQLRWRAVRLALTSRRTAENRRRHEESLAMERPEAERNPDGDGARRETLEALRREMGRLPDELRIATVLRFQEGLPFAAMAELAGVAESTMFERVKTALAKLRSALAVAGHGAAVVDLEALLTVPETVAVPPGLAAALATLAKGSLGLGGFAAAAAVVLAAGIGAWRLQESGAPAAAPLETSSLDARSGAASPDAMHDDTARPPAPLPAVVPVRAVDHASAAAPHDDTPRDAGPPRFARDFLVSDLPLPNSPDTERVVATGHLRGRAVDDHGTSLAHARVIAGSTPGPSKGVYWGREGTADAEGRFDLEVAVVADAGQEYWLRIVHPDTLDLRVVAQAAAGRATELGEVVASRNEADRAGAFDLDLVVVAPDGAPAANVPVRLDRKLVARTDAPPAPPPEASYTREASGFTDANGIVRFTGTRVGTKRLFLVGRGAGLRDRMLEIDVAAGHSEKRVALEAGATLRGRLGLPGDVVAAEILRATTVVATPADGGDPFEGQIEADGSFCVRGLDPGRYRLVVRGPLSPVRVDDVAAGRDDLSLQLKRRDDERDVGDHDAEIHGRIVDAATGAPIEVRDHEIEVMAVPAAIADDPERRTEEGTTEFDRFAAFALRPRQGQSLRVGAPPPPSSALHVVGLEPGAYLVIVRAAGHAPARSGLVRLAARQVVRDLELPITRNDGH